MVIIIVVVLVKKRRAKVAEGSSINVSDMIMVQEESPKKRKKNNFEKELERFLILAEGKVRDQFLELVKILEQEDLAEECIFKMAFFKFQEMKLEKLKSLFKAIE